MATFHLLGPIYLGEGTHAFLGLEISSEVEPVVVVWLPPNQGEESLEHIRQQALAAAALKHPNILKLRGVYELDGRLARIVDYVDGEPLQRFLEVGKSFPVPMAARIVCDAVEGIHYAHSTQSPPWVHGALRPETLMLSFSGMVRVSGYGAQVFALKKPADPRLRGRRKHIAPEQIIGGTGADSPQTDIYLLGLCLYECITGMVPFIAETNFEEAVLTRPLPPMPPETPSALEAVIAKACAKKAQERYASVLEFRQAIISAVGVLPSAEALAALLNEWVPPTEKSRNHRQQLMDEGLNQLLSRNPFKPQTNPEDLVLPPVSTENLPRLTMEAAPLPATDKHPPLHLNTDKHPPLHLNTEAMLSQEAMTLPPYKVEPSTPKPPTASAPIFTSQPRSPAPPKAPPPPYEEEEAERSSSSALTWGVGGFIAACALAVIVYFTLLAPAPQPPVSSGVVAPAFVPPPEPAQPPQLVNLEEPPPPPPTATSKTQKSRASGSAKTPAKTPSKTPAKTKATPAPAQVNIHSETPLDIFFKGKRMGTTPTQIALPPGKVSLVFSNKSAGIRTRRHLELRPGQNVDVDVQLAKGTLNINAPAGAKIWVDGVLKGTAPLGDIELWEGEHRLSVNHNNNTLSENFSLAPGGYMNYDVMQTQN